ncbi:serine hydrolase domain-containing protein [Hyphococcus sp.]|uniref:serine hydrolase domain-containing protein n=1 Tax=Hyphococcus sp. TaxID=2038636 RepID=UPI0020834A71|nr:MAG: FmtA-like protein [Marinicaulis sp.]
MRPALFSSFVAFVMTALASSALAQIPAPDASPSTPVDEVVLAPFEPSREDAMLEAYIDGVVGAHQREHAAPAISVSVVRDGRIVFAKAYGEADVEAGKAAHGVDTMFRIGSVSKTFTWTAVMMLHDRGLIDLDADVNKYLKGIQIPDAFDAPITMNDLMAHRAGFEDTFAVFTYPDEGEATLTQALTETMPKRVYAPGARTSYSNWGAALAAKIVEDISGVPYREFLEQEILGPLSMTHTTIEAPSLMSDADRPSLAVGYDVSAGAYKRADYMQIGPFAPAGAMASSAHDMAQWMLVHLGAGAYNGAQIMRADTHDLMWSRAFTDRTEGADLAHGFQARVYRGVKTFGHGGATTSFYTDMTLVPELGLGIFISQSTSDDRGLVFDLAPLVIDHVLDRPAAPARDDPNFAETAETFAGEYFDNRRSFSLFEKLFAASDGATVETASGGALTISSGDKVKHFAPLPGAADTFENRNGERVVFGRDAKGHVTHFTDGSGVHSYDRVDITTDANLLNLSLLAVLLFAATTMLGAWRRQGREVAQSSTGALIGVAAFAVAVLSFAFGGAIVWLMATLSNATASTMQAYPLPAVSIFRLMALAMFAVGVAGMFSLWPVWRASGWGLWRKMHHVLFAIALASLAVMLVFWNVVFAGVA